MNAIRARLTYANVMATIAAFAALGGTGYAAVSLPKASVGAKQLKTGSVTAKKIKKGAVGSAAVKDAGLMARDFAAGQLPAGPKGDKGDKGDRGDTGAPGTARAYTYLNEDTCADPSGPCTLPATHTKGFLGARRSDVGIYCLALDPASGVDRDRSIALTTVDWSETDSPEGNTSAIGQFMHNGCDSNEVRVRTYRWTTGGNAATSNTVSFYVAVP
jgi:hypothetical protein